jgi:hypothetical protein
VHGTPWFGKEEIQQRYFWRDEELVSLPRPESVWAFLFFGGI